MASAWVEGLGLACVVLLCLLVMAAGLWWLELLEHAATRRRLAKAEADRDEWRRLCFDEDERAAVLARLEWPRWK